MNDGPIGAAFVLIVIFGFIYAIVYLGSSKKRKNGPA